MKHRGVFWVMDGKLLTYVYSKVASFLSGLLQRCRCETDLGGDYQREATIAKGNLCVTICGITSKNVVFSSKV